MEHIISKEGVSFDPSKVQAVIDWHVPKNVVEVQSFLGFTGYYRRFVKDFSKIAKPLTNLMEKSYKILVGWCDTPYIPNIILNINIFIKELFSLY